MIKTICIFVNNAWYGYNFRFNLAKELKLKGYDVYFIAPYDKKYTALIEKEFNFYHLDIDPKGINPIADLKMMKDLYKIFSKVNTDVVLNFTIKPNIYGALVCKLKGINSINNITGLGTVFISQNFITKVVKLLYKLSLSSVKKVFFQNKDDLTLFLSNKLVNSEKCDTLPGSGVDLDKFIPIEKKKNKDKFVFLLIARLLKDKGIVEFIEATKKIKPKYDNVEFHLLGAVGVKNKTAITPEELQNWVDAKLITYLGTTDNVQEVIAESDCIVLPSYREGLPRVLLEASAMEKPLIATNVIGCKDVVEDGLNGYLCEVKNSDDLALKIEKMINLSKEEREAMAKEARKKIIENFDEKIVINKYFQAIEEII